MHRTESPWQVRIEFSLRRTKFCGLRLPLASNVRMRANEDGQLTGNERIPFNCVCLNQERVSSFIRAVYVRATRIHTRKGICFRKLHIQVSLRSPINVNSTCQWQKRPASLMYKAIFGVDAPRICRLSLLCATQNKVINYLMIGDFRSVSSIRPSTLYTHLSPHNSTLNYRVVISGHAISFMPLLVL